MRCYLGCVQPLAASPEPPGPSPGPLATALPDVTPQLNQIVKLNLVS